MAAELVHSATSEKLTDVNWGKNIKICEEVARNPWQAKDVIKQIKKRLGSKNSNTQLFSAMLLEMLMNNIGEHIHREVINVGLLPVLVKIVKKKSDSPIRERIFLLLDATQTSLGGASGKFPQYYTAYHDLVSAGVQFSQGPQAVPPNRSTSKANNDNPTSASVKSNDLTDAEIASSKHERDTHDAASEIISESSIILKADNALEVLREVLDAADAQNSEGAKDEFTLDLVEQCSFQKQRVMQLVLKSKDEKVVSRAIDLNEELQRVLARHDALLSGRPTSNTNNRNCEETEEDDEFGQILQSIIQKADHALEVLREVLDVAGTQNPEGAKDEFILDLVEQCSFQKQRVMQLVLKSKDEKVLSRAIDLNEELQRVLARHDALLSGRPTLITDNCNHEETEEDEEFGQLFRRLRKGKACATPEDEAHSTKHPVGLLESFSPGDRVRRPIIRPLCLDPSYEPNPHPPAVTIPPPPAKHVEREKFFQDKKVDGGGSVAAHMRSLSLHSRDASSSHSSSFDSSD